MKLEYNTFITALGGIEFTATNLPEFGVGSLGFASAI